ncbi:bifunctional phosphopantothenoylcysteine decarboxylase/phosphopantothenate--cysteine ligase CoaBC [Arthrobacter woluwensis]|uniref:bifunctional phosphopantothenoylcysteine decarboxylase/phosphopantothenate--cysteine ligase CoaBC n=1 Tax=Arthrobacter woluwensis TaxID=156980 RepID=UPI000D13296D|nr:bifunctional phosphopantothenoylcysteine decarboxylase/phosphopantothenate--cysteine ligase CoaBC [Arthrobacter woluwensis]PSS45138.1 bifunctional phosphopantothenoylcysteine decarboxylase/phosphopantothenate--cysteine ligase CoaBC [Arthrobacter woluwensis]
MRIVLGVGGGIAAFKVASLLRLFTEQGHQVNVVPTEAALHFVGQATWEALSGHPVSTSVFEHVEQVNHVRLGQEADLVVVAPATANILARSAHGLADDLLGNTLLVATCPVLFAPAMHTEMWRHPATQANVATLRAHGAHVLDPDVGRLTGKDSGPGRLPEPQAIFAAAMALVSAPDEAHDGGSAGALLAGKRVLVSAGGTQEPLDPVRFLGNRSSGKQGIALAAAARDAGAAVTLVAAHVEVALPAGVDVVRVGTAEELREVMTREAASADVVLMAAAVADFRPAERSGTKIKKRAEGADPVIELVRNPDILAELVRLRAEDGREQLILGFAAETGDDSGSVLEYARQKLERKGCDLLVVNHVGESKVFGQDVNSVEILSRTDREMQHVEGSKNLVAEAIVHRVAAELRG